MAEKNTDIHIDTSQIPDYVRDRIAAATFEFIHRVLQQPGGREALDARIAKSNSTAR